MRSESGQNLVEFAMVVTLLLTLVIGIVEFGRVWMTYQVITNASREGARLAALPAGFTNAGAVSARVNTYMASANLKPAQATVTVNNVDGATGTDAVVVIQYQARMLFLAPIVTLLDAGSSMPGTFTLTGTATMRNE